MKRTLYYDALRGPLAVRPVKFISGRTEPNGINTGPCVVCRVTARSPHSGYKRGELINCAPYRIVRLLSGQRCYSVGIDVIKKEIERSTQQ